MSEWKLFKSYLDYVKFHYDSMETWNDNDKLQEAIYSIEKEICRLERRCFNMKQRGYKVIKIYVEDGKLFYDIAVFGDDSLIVENVQLCEKVYEKITTETKTQIEADYGKELLHNFINDMLIIQ